MDRTCMSYWFPKVLATGLPVPKTEMLETDVEMRHILDSGNPEVCQGFIREVENAASRIGYPVFLRTGHGSDKHDWKDTCCVNCREDVEPHMRALAIWSETVDMLGLPYQVWAVRELMRTEPAFHAFQGEMPITRERRYFFRDGYVEYHHPYWPPNSIAKWVNNDVLDIGTKGTIPKIALPKDWRSRLAVLNRETDTEVAELIDKTLTVARVFDGYWSVDWLHTVKRGWVLTDMAEGDRSFRWNDYCRAEE